MILKNGQNTIIFHFFTETTQLHGQISQKVLSQPPIFLCAFDAELKMLFKYIFIPPKFLH